MNSPKRSAITVRSSDRNSVILLVDFDLDLGGTAIGSPSALSQEGLSAFGIARCESGGVGGATDDRGVGTRKLNVSI